MNVKTSLTARLVLTSGLLIVAGILAVAIPAIWVLHQVKVNGPVYAEIVMGKDLVADILPPPAYIIEPYLICLQMANERDPARLAEMIERGRVLKEGDGGCDQRYAHWAKALPEGQLRTAMVESAHAEANRFFELRDKHLVPLLTAGRFDEAQRFVIGELSQAFERQRSAINAVVVIANKLNADNESRAAHLIARGWLILGLAAAAAIAGGLGLALVVARRVVAPVAAVNGMLSSLAGGDLTRRVEVSSQDEIGTMAGNLNKTTDGLRSMMGAIGQNAQSIASAAEECRQSANNSRATLKHQLLSPVKLPRPPPKSQQVSAPLLPGSRRWEPASVKLHRTPDEQQISPMMAFL